MLDSIAVEVYQPYSLECVTRLKHYTTCFLVNLNKIILFHNLILFLVSNSSARGTCTTCKAFNLWRDSWLFKHMVYKYRISLPFSELFENEIPAYYCRFIHSVCKIIGGLLVLPKFFVYRSAVIAHPIA